MSKRGFTVLALLSMLAGCGGNPFVNQEDPGADGGTPDTTPGSVYGDDLNDDLVMNSMVYDPDGNVIVVNNIPFDGATAANGQAEYEQTGTLPGDFGRYENVAGANRYFAVFRRSGTGAVEAGAFGTTAFVDFGLGGAAAKRLATSVSLPNSGEYTFTGEYAAIRIFDSASGINTPQYVTGAAEIDIDFGDFDGIGAILGTVSGRQVYDSAGAPLGVMDDYISLALGNVDRSNGTIDGGGASLRETSTGSIIASGDWSGVIGGTNGTELAGIVVLEGAVDDAGGTGNMRETGVIIAAR
ncbi:hypothetical protein LHP98_12150 [Rhodobacter sp. Har01]|uniref:hypothetical protein n=1 Tax=Rhodobacter sp. Har01 TaxID=2883999 RepID=UPI001D06D356|nr:hypothetical protein [Rhodobacter sp. Har01]MCB6178878.1 hypothetical protein [Rhodobacter sp. Har01]